MKGKVIVQIPERQYEFLRIEYEFETEAQEKEAIRRAKMVADEHILQWGKAKPDHEQVIGGVRWRNKDGKWQYWDEKIGWVL